MIGSLARTLRFIATHPLAARSLPQAFARYIRWQVVSRVRREVEIDWIDGAKLVATRGMTGATGNIYCGLHELSDMAFVLHFLQRDDLFFDCGANIGSYTVLASAVCGARTIAFEPDPSTVARLDANIRANRIGHLVDVRVTALGGQTGKVMFSRGLDTTNRVVAGLPSDGQYREVAVGTLDDATTGQQPTLIKIDVEGYEPEVIAGAGGTIRKASLRAILLETIDADIMAELSEAGFVQVHYDPFRRKLEQSMPKDRRHTANSLFVRDIAYCTEVVTRAPHRRILGTDI